MHQQLQKTNDEPKQLTGGHSSFYSNLESQSKPVHMDPSLPLVQLPQQIATLSIAPGSGSRVATSLLPKRRRPIIIDGCNVAYQHGLNDRYSAKGLKLVYEYLVDNLGYENSKITIITKRAYMSREDKEIVDFLYKTGVLIYSVSY